MKAILEILVGFVAVAVFLWLFLKLNLLLDDLGARLFGPSFRLRRTRAPKAEIQTLFHGNTKDQDQI